MRLANDLFSSVILLLLDPNLQQPIIFCFLFLPHIQSYWVLTSFSTFLALCFHPLRAKLPVLTTLGEGTFLFNVRSFPTFVICTDAKSLSWVFSSQVNLPWTMQTTLQELHTVPVAPHTFFVSQLNGSSNKLLDEVSYNILLQLDNIQKNLHL